MDLHLDDSGVTDAGEDGKVSWGTRYPPFSLPPFFQAVTVAVCSTIRCLRTGFHLSCPFFGWSTGEIG